MSGDNSLKMRHLHKKQSPRVGINASGLPKINDRFTLALGYVDGDKQQLFDKGRYIISRPKLSLMSGIVTINGTAAPFKLNNETEFEKKRT